MAIPCTALIHSVIIQERVNSDDGYGGYSTSWVSKYTMQGNMLFKGGNETLISQGIVSRRSWELTIRFSPGIDATCRVVFKGRVFNIKYVNNVEERNRWLILGLEEIVPD